MAWIRWHDGQAGLRYANVQWRDPKTQAIRTRALGPISAESADEERRRVERVEEKREPRGRRTEAHSALDGFLASRGGPGRSKATVAYYRDLLRPLVAALGSRPIRVWRRSDLEAYVATKASWSPRRVEMLLVACRTWIRWCRESRGLDVPNFVGALRAPKRPHVERPALTGKHLAALLRAAEGGPLHLPIALATYAGLPLGDVRALDWKDVDLRAGWITRARAKTGERIRVPIVAALATILSGRRATHGPVCRGLPKSPSAVSALVRRLFAAAGVPREKGQGLHLLRHSFATLASANGADVETVRSLLGHAKGSAITLRYLHTDDARLKDAAQKVERAVAG